MQDLRFNTYPIQWYEGMFVVPQHFQQMDLLNRQTLAYHLAHLNPYGWGVKSVKVDPAQLVNGFLRILSAEVMFPDGTVVFFPDHSADALEVSLTDLHAQEPWGDKAMRAYLCIPEHMHSSESLVRYQSVEAAPAKDFNAEGDPAVIARLKPRLSLMISDKPPARHVSVPLLEMVCQGGRFSQTSYQPPMLMVDLNSDLGGHCLDLVKRVRDKLIYLQSKIQSSSSDPEFGAQIIEKLEGVRQKLVVGLLPFESLLKTGLSHPYALFQALTNLAAYGYALRLGHYPPPALPYDHSDPGSGFHQLIILMEDVLANIEESYTSLNLEQKDRVYSLTIHPEWVKNARLVFGARTQPGSTEDEIARWIQETVIASDSSIEIVQENRVLGAARTIVSTVPELNLVPPRGVVLFTVEVDPRFIRLGETLRFFNISDTAFNRPQLMTLYLHNETDINHA